jgi:hypothetical protein
MLEPTNIWQVYATTLLKHCKIIATYLGWMTSGHTIMVTEMHRDQLQILGKFRSFFFFYEILSKVDTNSKIWQKFHLLSYMSCQLLPNKMVSFFFLLRRVSPQFCQLNWLLVLRVMYKSVVNQEEICLGCFATMAALKLF